MNTYPLYVVDFVSEVLDAVSQEILSTIIKNETSVNGGSNIQLINYRYGHRLELIETLIQLDKDSVGGSNMKKYPLVYLVMDFSEKRGEQDGVYATLALNIIIAHKTQNTDKITDRYTKVFKPVLYPIYYSLIEQFAAHPLVLQGNEDKIQHTKIDRGYWGRTALSSDKGAGTAANNLSDYVDAIEIQNLQLKLYYETGCDQSSSTNS